MKKSFPFTRLLRGGLQADEGRSHAAPGLAPLQIPSFKSRKNNFPSPETGDCFVAKTSPSNDGDVNGYKKAFSVFLFLALPILSHAVESPISRKLQGMAESLVQGYAAKKTGTEKESLAVLSFSSSEKLTKTKVGFAVSELLTHFFVQRPEFTVVERNLLNKLEDEQKFQAMSADTATAVRIGKIIGAKLMVLGSVEKVGGAYQTNARLVRTETGEILAATFEELPAKDFEDEAKPYLNLVPERQAIGFYSAYQVRSKAKAKETLVKIDPAYSNTTTVTPKDFDSSFVGGGLRYFPHPHFLIDLSFLASASHPSVLSFRSQSVSPFGSISRYSSEQNLRSGYQLRASVSWTSYLSNSVRWALGAGMTRYHLYVQGGGSDLDVSLNSSHPFVLAGLEYRPQQRFGLGLAINQELTAIDGKYAPGGTAFRLSGLSVEPSLALYF